MKIKNAVIFPLLVLIIGSILWFFLIRFPVMRYESSLEFIPINNPSENWIYIKKDQKRVYALQLKLVGKLEGSANLTLKINDTIPYLTRALNPGEISMEFKTEWYFDSCQIYYKPIDIKKGNLKLTYRFLSVE